MGTAEAMFYTEWNPFFSYIIGTPSPPLELNVTVPSRGLGVRLTWKQGFAFQGEEVNFIISFVEISSRLQMEACTNLTSIMLSPATSTCQLYNFTVYSENRFSRSNSAVTQNVLLPAGQFTLHYFL